MPEPIAIVISDTYQARLRLDVLNRKFPQSDDFWDGNWLDIWFELEVGGFTCKLTDILRIEVLEQFHQELVTLYRDLRGTAALKANYERWLDITFTGDGRGHLDIECFVNDNDEQSSLRVRLYLDQTHLPPIIDALALVLNQYPPIKR